MLNGCRCLPRVCPCCLFVQYLRTALVSYALLFMQTLFFKRKMGKEVPKTA